MKWVPVVARLCTPLIAVLVLTGILIAERSGMKVEAYVATLGLLPYEQVASEPDRPTLLLAYDSAHPDEAPYVETLTGALDQMRIVWLPFDVSSEPMPSLDGIDTILLCSSYFNPLVKNIEEISPWLSGGGHLGCMMTPTVDDDFRVCSRILGIVEYTMDYHLYTSFQFATDILPLMKGVPYSQDGRLKDYTLVVRLEDDCIVHMESVEEYAVPLMWEYDFGEGRTAVFNTTLMSNKDSRGFALAMLTALSDTLVYPVINAGMVFIDDFPAPQPEGVNERLLNDFGYDIKGFFRNLWWPEMKQLTWDYGLAYSGVLVETYNDQIVPPFEPEETGELLRFYASEIMRAGGEIGLHGYNHMPLCLEGFPYPADIDYKGWPSTREMELAIEELYQYGTQLFPEATFQTYVPPSNYLSAEGRATLRKVVPNVRVISGLYLYEEGVQALVQEFGEEADGSISLPRLSSGFIPNQYNQMLIANELAFHGVYSHFVHPDDVLDESRGATSGWKQMYDTFERMIGDVKTAYPPLRFTTSSEGAGAVQRYDRLNITRTESPNALQLSLTPFYEDAWLSIRTRRTPASVTGGTLHVISDGFYWFEASEANVVIEWEATP